MSRPLVASLVLAGVLCACGVPSEGPVGTVPAEDVPYGLLTPRSTASATPEASRGALEVYFVLNEHLVAVPVGEPPGDDPLAAVLNALTAGPSTARQQDGLGTSIPPGLHLSSSVTADGTVSVDLHGDAAQPDVGQNPLSTGQIVLSVTGLPGYRRVLLTRNGQSLEAVLPSGELTGSPVTADDYRELVTPSTSPSGP